MKLNKSHITPALVIVLFILLIFMTNIVEKIQNKEAQQIVIIIIYILVITFLIAKVYNNFTKRQYSNFKLIILAEVIQIVSCTVSVYIVFKTFNPTDINTILKFYDARFAAQLFFYGGMLLESILKGKGTKKTI